jgi:hypothetical protein
MGLLELVPIREVGAGKFIPSEFVTPFNKYELPWGEKTVGFISDAAATVIAKNNDAAAKFKKKRSKIIRGTGFPSSSLYSSPRSTIRYCFMMTNMMNTC